MVMCATESTLAPLFACQKLQSAKHFKIKVTGAGTVGDIELTDTLIFGAKH